MTGRVYVQLNVRAGTVSVPVASCSGARGPSERLGFTRGLPTRLPRPIDAHRHRSRAFEADRRWRPDYGAPSTDPSRGTGKVAAKPSDPPVVSGKIALWTCVRRVKPLSRHVLYIHTCIQCTSECQPEYSSALQCIRIIY